MKIMKISTITAVIATILFSCGGKDPMTYNNSLMTIINDNEASITKMNTAMSTANYAEAEKIRKEWNANLTSQIKTVTDLGDYNGDAGLQQGVLTGLKAYQKIVAEDYPELIAIRKDQRNEPAQESKLLDNINNTFETAANAVNKAANDFEKKYSK